MSFAGSHAGSAAAGDAPASSEPTNDNTTVTARTLAVDMFISTTLRLLPPAGAER
jgi:hypothetical protein